MAGLPTLILVHSPLLAPMTWEPTGQRLQAAGYPVVVPSLRSGFEGGPPYYPRLAAQVEQALDPGQRLDQIVLVGHSGAGGLLSVISEALDGTDGAIFVDAILPHAGASWFDTASTQLEDQLRKLVRQDGRLPAWDHWFRPETLERLIPDADLRARLCEELPELPLLYFDEVAPLTETWPDDCCGYLQLSRNYEEAADEAENRGWSVLRRELDHLAILTQPETINSLIIELVGAVAP